MIERVETYRDLLARTPVDELDVHEQPRVIFRVGENTWLEAIVRYLVAPREAGRVKTRLIKKLLAALNAAPDKVMFPAGANRLFFSSRRRHTRFDCDWSSDVCSSD